MAAKKVKIMSVKDQFGESVPLDSLRVLKDLSEMPLGEPLQPEEVNDICDATWYTLQAMDFILVSGDEVPTNYTDSLEDVGLTHIVLQRPILRVGKWNKVFGYKRGFYVKEG